MRRLVQVLIILVALLATLLLVASCGKKYGAVPHVLRGNWGPMYDGEIGLKISDHKIIAFNEEGVSQTCFVKSVRVKRNIFGMGGEVSVSCEPFRVEKARLWRCASGDTYTKKVYGRFEFEQELADFQGIVTVHDDSFLSCYGRSMLGDYVPREP